MSSGWTNIHGYRAVRAPGHPLAWANGSVLEHRKIAYDGGLFIDPTFVVHHINGDKTDNRIENLEVLPPDEHIRRHHAANRLTTYWSRHGWRECRTCTLERSRRRRATA